jgi:tetratricopeptide (TPR) repeat protein
LDIEPHAPEAYLIQGDLYQAQNQFIEAIASYTRGLQLQPKQPDDTIISTTCIKLGDTLFTVNRPLEAISQYERAIAIAPSVKAHWMLGRILEGQGWVELALQHYREAMTIDPAFFTPDSHINVGRLFHERNFCAEAANFFNAALRLQPDYAPAYQALGNLLIAQGDVAAAAKLYAEAEIVDLDLITAKQYNDLGVACIRHNKLDEAIGHFQTAIQIQPDYADAHCNLGNTFLQQQNLREAVICFQEALSIDPNFEEVYYNLGTSLAKLDRLDEAITFLHAAISISPNFADAHYNLASALVKLNQKDLATLAYKRAIALRPDYTQPQWDLGL